MVLIAQRSSGYSTESSVLCIPQRATYCNIKDEVCKVDAVASLGLEAALMAKAGRTM